MKNVISDLNCLYENGGGRKLLLDWWDDGSSNALDLFSDKYREIIATICNILGKPIYSGIGDKDGDKAQHFQKLLEKYDEASYIWEKNDLIFVVRCTFHDAGTIRKVWLIVDE